MLGGGCVGQRVNNDKLFQQVYDCDSKLVEPDMHERSDKNIDWLLDSRTNGIEETKN